MNVVDMFKSPNEDRPKESSKIDYYNRSIKNSYGINVSNTHRPTEQSDLKKLMNSITECKVINRHNEGISVSVSGCNRVQKIEINNELSLRYEDCTKIEDVTDNSKYDMYKANNYKVYNLWKYNYVANGENIHMVIAVR